MYTYLLINLGVISFPLLRSFENKIRFFSRWKALLPAIMLPMVLFILWDAVFTSKGIWGFNPDFLLGVQLLGLPLGEWLFFITVPYACLFIHEVLRNYFPQPLPARPYQMLARILGGTLILLGVFLYPRMYPFVTFLLAGLCLIAVASSSLSSGLGAFFRTYLICWIPFLLVNGLLTGTGLGAEVVWYNEEEIIGWRILTIPVEDGVYMLLLLLSNISIYEWLRPEKERVRAA